MESNNNVIMLTTDWHPVACISYFVTCTLSKIVNQ